MKKLLAVTTMLLVIGIANSLQAVTLQDLFSGGTITVDDKLLSNWMLSSENISDQSLFPDYDMIQVEPLLDQSMNPGIRFVTNGEFSTTEANLFDIFFLFNVTRLDPNYLIKDTSLELIDYSFEESSGGAISIAENIFDETGMIFLGTSLVYDDNASQVSRSFDSAEFAPQDTILMGIRIHLIGTEEGDILYLNSFDQRFSQVAVPEPATILLLGVGLVGIGALRRK